MHTESIRNLEVIFYDKLNFRHHISLTCRCCFMIYDVFIGICLFLLEKKLLQLRCLLIDRTIVNILFTILPLKYGNNRVWRATSLKMADIDMRRRSKVIFYVIAIHQTIQKHSNVLVKISLHLYWWPPSSKNGECKCRKSPKLTNLKSMTPNTYI